MEDLYQALCLSLSLISSHLYILILFSLFSSLPSHYTIPIQSSSPYFLYSLLLDCCCVLTHNIAALPSLPACYCPSLWFLALYVCAAVFPDICWFPAPCLPLLPIVVYAPPFMPPCFPSSLLFSVPYWMYLCPLACRLCPCCVCLTFPHDPFLDLPMPCRPCHAPLPSFFMHACSCPFKKHALYISSLPLLLVAYCTYLTHMVTTPSPCPFIPFGPHCLPYDCAFPCVQPCLHICACLLTPTPVPLYVCPIPAGHIIA